MTEFSDLETRIERLRSRAESERLTPELVDEIENVLAEGYVAALQADARSRRLRERVDALVDDTDVPRMAQEMRRLGRERRMLEQAAGELRERVGVLQSLVARAARQRTRST
jgi:hypothetical protein